MGKPAEPELRKMKQLIKASHHPLAASGPAVFVNALPVACIGRGSRNAYRDAFWNLPAGFPPAGFFTVTFASWLPENGC